MLLWGDLLFYDAGFASQRSGFVIDADAGARATIIACGSLHCWSDGATFLGATS